MDMRLLLALLCVNAPASALDALAEAERELLAAGLVRGDAPDWNCIGPTFVISDGGPSSVKVRTLGDRELTPYEQAHREFEGQRIRYEAESRGEWGGTVIAILPTGERRIVIGDHARAFFPSVQAETRLYVFAGLSHLSTSDGAVYAIDTYDSEPVVTRITLLPDTPELVLRNTERPHRDRFWIVGGSSIMEVIQDRALLVHAIHQFHFRRISSALQRDRSLLIGACGAVAVVNVAILDGSLLNAGPPVKYYVPASLRAN